MMKKVLLLITFILPLAISAKVYNFSDLSGLNNESVESKILKSNVMEVKFSINKLTTNKSTKRIPYNDGFELLNVKGLSNMHKVGAPSLPFHSMIIVGHPSDLSFEVSKGSEYELDVVPSPYQKAPCRCKKSEEEIPFTLNEESYENSGKLIQRVSYLGDFKGVPLTHVMMTPFQYKRDKLLVFPELKVFIKNKTTQTEKFSFKNVLKTAGKKYVIFSPNEFHSALNRLVSHKRGLGFDVEVVSKESLGNDFETIKNKIHKKYKKQSFDYALVVGHEQKFPTDYVMTSNDPKTPSDLGYFTMSGNSDNIPDVLFGRLTADTVQDVENQITKIIEYETRSWSDSSGLGRMMGIASDEGWNPTDVEYTNSFTDPFKRSFSTEVVNIFQENQDSTPENINKAFNAGLMWVNYIGHGSGPSWISVKSREYFTSDIKEINPGKVKPVIVDVACQNGRFSLDDRLGERFMNETKNGEPIGAVAFYGGSVDISWHPPAVMARGVSEIVAGNPNQTIGEVLLAGQVYLIQNYDDRNASTENLKWYHLQGDPTLKLQVR